MISIVRNSISILLVVFAAAASILGQSGKPNESTIVPCRWEIAAKLAEFRQSFGYSVDVSDDGTISKISQVSNSQRGLKIKFVRDEVFVSCIEKWRLQPAGKYYVSFNVGTMSLGKGVGPTNYMQIIDPNKNKLKIEIFLAENDTLVVEKPGRRP